MLAISELNTLTRKYQLLDGHLLLLILPSQEPVQLKLQKYVHEILSKQRLELSYLQGIVRGCTTFQKTGFRSFL